MAPNIKKVAVALAKATDPKVTSLDVEAPSRGVNDTWSPKRSAGDVAMSQRHRRAVTGRDVVPHDGESVSPQAVGRR